MKMTYEIFECKVSNLEDQKITFNAFSAVSLFDITSQVENYLNIKLNLTACSNEHYVCKVSNYPFENISGDNYIYLRVNNFYIHCQILNMN